MLDVVLPHYGSDDLRKEIKDRVKKCSLNEGQHNNVSDISRSLRRVAIVAYIEEYHGSS